jgi:5-formyltetrahydrofolate cyclo-ligase
VNKAEFRSHCLGKMKERSRHNKHYMESKLHRKLHTLIRRVRAKSILLYWPLPIEADLRKLIWELPREMQVYLPFMEDVSFKMVPFRLPLERKQFGIYEPGNTFRKIKKVDIAIVPAVGIDADARRIGFGKGMYDRFFATLKNKPVIFFVQLEPCHSPQRICDDHDISADVVVTPGTCYSKTGTKNVKRSTLRRRHCHAQRSSRFFHFKKNNVFTF